MRIPDSSIEEIERKIDIVQVVSRYVQLQQRGQRYLGLCPFHAEKTPSFSVSPERNAFYCFGCRKGGSVFTFLMEIDGLSFPEAVEQLAEEAGVVLPRRSGESEEHDEAAKRTAALKDLYRRVAGSFHHILANSPKASEARDYLERRSVTPQLRELYGIGYAPDSPNWLFQFLRGKGYSPEFLAQTGLFTRKNPQRSLFQGRVVFPIRTPRGEVVAFGGRSIDGREPKYLNSPDSPLFSKRELLFGLDLAKDRARRERTIYVVEGYTDVLACRAAGVENVVAPLGTALTEHHTRLLQRYSATVTLVFDSDSAGLEASRRAAMLLEAAELKATVCELPENRDPAEIFEESGSKELKKTLSYTKDVFVFLVSRALQRVDVSTPDGKEFAMKEVFPYIEAVRSEVKRDACLKQFADTLGVDPAALVHDFQRRGTRRVQPASKPEQQGPTELVITTDLFLMLAVVANRDQFVLVRRMLEIEDLHDNNAVALFLALEESFRRGEQAFELLIERIENRDLRRVVVEKLASEEFALNKERAIYDAVLSIKERSYRHRQREVESRLRRLSSEPSATHDTQKQIDELLEQKMYLDKELNKLKVLIDDRFTE